MARLRPDSRQRSRTRWLVDHSHSLLFCPIEKVGVTQWPQLFFALIGKPCRDAFGSMVWAEKHLEAPMFIAFPAAHQQRMLQCDTFVRVVAVRDPLERFLSAFLDKCVANVSRGVDQTQLRRHCPGFVDAGKRPPTFSKFIASFAAQPSQLWSTDMHFRPQCMFCGLAPPPELQRPDEPPMLPRVQVVHRRN